MNLSMIRIILALKVILLHRRLRTAGDTLLFLRIIDNFHRNDYMYKGCKLPLFKKFYFDKGVFASKRTRELKYEITCE